jgi:glycosyltransferase involved in cell wall biosynthesis
MLRRRPFLTLQDHIGCDRGYPGYSAFMSSLICFDTTVPKPDTQGLPVAPHSMETAKSVPDSCRPLFSIVIPVFNRCGPLEGALTSVFGQSCQDFEILVVDDGSTDDPVAVLKRLGDDRVRFLEQDHKGGNAARNLGIDNARGKYVALLDSDDEFRPHHLATMRALLQGTTNTVAYAPVIVQRGPETTYVKPPRALGPDEEMASYLLRERGYVSTSTTVLAAEVARRVRYDEQLRFGQDTDFAIRLWLDGQDFIMASEPAALWEDSYRPDRVSSGRKGPLLIQWLERLRPNISRRAYLGYRGWAIAKGVVFDAPLTALSYYLAAVLSGCYRPRLAAVIFAQIFVSDRLYRIAADWYIAVRGRIALAANAIVREVTPTGAPQNAG